MRTTVAWNLALLAALSLSSEVLARGGGRMGGGMGGMRMGGGGMGGFHPSPGGFGGGMRSGNFGGGNFGGGNFGGGNFGGMHPNFGDASSFGGFSGPARFDGGGLGERGGMNNSFGEGRGFNSPGFNGARNFGGGDFSGRDAFENRGAYRNPGESQLGNFLGLPGGSEGRTGSLGESGSKSWTTPGGSTVTIGGGSGSRTGPRGNTIGGAGAGIKVDGAGGNTYAKGVGGMGVTNGTNSASRAGGVSGFEGRNGYTAVNARGVAGVNGNLRAGSASAIRGPDGNTIAGGRGANFVHGQFVGGNTWAAVNRNYRHWDYWNRDWYRRYPGAWWPERWAIASSVWYAASWATAGAYCGCVDEPMYYDYGNNVTYNDDGNVYFGDQSQGTAADYYDQASLIASNTSSDNEEWLPLGVFAIVSDEEQTKSDKTIQLAVNKDGVIRGNLQDSLTDSVKPVSGSVNKKTQRVAFSIEGNDKAVIETGLYNLTNDEVPVLVHLGPDHVEKHLLIRLKQPDDAGGK